MGEAGGERERGQREADSLTPGSEFSHPLKERPDCVRVLFRQAPDPCPDTLVCVCVCVCSCGAQIYALRADSHGGEKKHCWHFLK